MQSRMPIDNCTMGVRDEDFLNLAHLHIAFLHLVLGCFAAIEKPHISVKPQGK